MSKPGSDNRHHICQAGGMKYCGHPVDEAIPAYRFDVEKSAGLISWAIAERVGHGVDILSGLLLIDARV
jgi:hypothetical protein